jgi:RimJ/RimL family protein N-acetyltransferase
MTELRDLEVRDLNALVRWRNDSTVNRCLADRLRSKEEAEAWFKRVKAEPKIWLKAIIDDGQTIGYAAVESIDEKNRKCELAIVVGEPGRWGKGIGAFVMKTMLEYAFDVLRMHRVWAVTARGNDRSVRLIKGAGFQFEGVMRETIIIGGKFTDLLRYSILEDEYRTERARG